MLPPRPLTREDRSLLSRWWFTVDHQLLTAMLVLLLIGFALSLAAGPGAAARKGLDAMHFVERHGVHAAMGAVLIVGLSFLSPAGARRFCLGLFVFAVILVLATFFVGETAKGARRWVRIFGQSLQPSEFLKPAFIVLSAWLLAERTRRPDLPVLPLALVLLGVAVVPVVIQPDVGQAGLMVVVWVGLLFVSGVPLPWMAAAGLMGALGLAACYAVFDHVRRRIDTFITPTGNDTYQMDLARKSFIEGGFFGRGPGEGVVKTRLPDAHTDFVLAVIAEEYGVVACFVVIAVFMFIALRVVGHIWRERDSFLRNASAGLVMLLTCQALINMGVNVGLLPAKGMTLPFISYGGSALLAMAVAMGLALALTRRRPGEVRAAQTVPMGAASVGALER